MSPVERREPAKRPSLWWQQQGTTERQGGDPKNEHFTHAKSSSPTSAARDSIDRKTFSYLLVQGSPA